jgi:hypothetical protein
MFIKTVTGFYRKPDESSPISYCISLRYVSIISIPSTSSSPKCSPSVKFFRLKCINFPSPPRPPCVVYTLHPYQSFWYIPARNMGGKKILYISNFSLGNILQFCVSYIFTLYHLQKSMCKNIQIYNFTTNLKILYARNVLWGLSFFKCDRFKFQAARTCV